jgi:acetyltransferase-like isoleucine patch superfamily enzyme
MTNNRSRENYTVEKRAKINYKYSNNCGETKISEGVTIRSGTIVYSDVSIGEHTQTGHNALIRENTNIGRECIIGTNTVIDGYSAIGNNVSLQTGVYIPAKTVIHDNVFIGPKAVLTNDPYPVRQDIELEGPTIKPSVSIGANSTILPGVHVGEGSFVAAGAVVTKDVPPDTLAIGTPATFKPLPDQLQGENDI